MLTEEIRSRNPKREQFTNRFASEGIKDDVSPAGIVPW